MEWGRLTLAGAATVQEDDFRAPVGDPATGETLGYVRTCSTEDVRDAVASAHKAFAGWSGEASQTRGAILRRLAGLISEHAEDLAALLTAEQGKPLAESRAEVASAAGYFDFFAEEAKIVTEGAGAAGIAALLAHPTLFSEQNVGVILCGANIDARILANVLLRDLVRDGRLLRLSVDIADRPGVLADVAGRIAEAGGNIIDVAHQRLFAAPSVRTAELDLVVEARDAAHGAEILAALEGAAFRVKRL
mgnify:CR=1 FL=1